MGTNRSANLILAEVVWKEKSGNGWLLREVFDLLLRDPALVRLGAGPDLTDEDTPPTMQPSTVAHEKGGE